MRNFPLVSLAGLAGVLVAVAAVGCSYSSPTLPSSDGYGPLGGESQSSSGAAPSPTTGSTGTSAPTSTTPTPPPPPSSWNDAGSGWSDAGTSSGGAWDAGWDDSGGWTPDSGAGWAPEGGTGSGTSSTLLSLCVGEINELRNQNGAFPYIESSQLEAFAAQAAQSDATSGTFHGYFNQTNGGGVAFTEDEFDGAQIDQGGTAQQVLNQGLLDDEEDGNSRGFDNLVTNQFSEVGCGFAKDSTGNWWVTIEFQ